MVMVTPLAEEICPESLKPREGEIGRIGIRTVIRYGIQMVTHIGASGRRNIRFLERRLIKREGKRILQLDIENTGERRLSAVAWVEVFDEEGKSMGRFEGERRGIVPGGSVRQSFDLTLLPPGNYTALVIVDNLDGYVFGARYELEIN